MEVEGSFVNGGVLISHHMDDGKHHYEVEKVLKYKKGGKKSFIRKGDKLLKINGKDVIHLSPEDLAQSLSEGHPLMTVHKAVKKVMNDTEETLGDNLLYPVSMDTIVLNLHWEMTSEEECLIGPDEEENGGQDDSFNETERNSLEDKLLIVEMTKTRVSVIAGRGCGAGFHCKECLGNMCIFKDIVMVAESRTMTFVPRRGVSFKQQKFSEVFIKNKMSHLYLRSKERALHTSPNPERITIHYYKSTGQDTPYRGMPVVLNLTDSNCFLKCSKEKQKVFLQVETCERQQLMRISQSDENVLAFVFYMKSDRTKLRKFESALHLGWFICILESEEVKIQQLNEEQEESFLFIIQR